MQTGARKFDRGAERCLILQGSQLAGMFDCARFFERLVGVNPATVGWMAALTGMVLAAVVAIVAWHLRTGR